jgi:hypothetical protein
MNVSTIQGRRSFEEEEKDEEAGRWAAASPAAGSSLSDGRLRLNPGFGILFDE